MFDLGWLEILIIAITALIVVGPKDLPNLFKKVGVFVGKAKGMAREFQRGMEDAADHSGLNEASAAINKMNSLKEDPTGIKKKVVNEYFEKSKNKFSSLDQSNKKNQKTKEKPNKNDPKKENLSSNSINLKNKKASLKKSKPKSDVDKKTKKTKSLSSSDVKNLESKKVSSIKKT
tara:strand:- start:564 stop:1088 length:525 start_codon:yes stop_codon:yes gene_type:complete